MKLKEVELTWTAAWPMWTAVKQNKRKHLRRQDSGIFEQLHVRRSGVAGGATLKKEREMGKKERERESEDAGPLIWRMLTGCPRCAPVYLCTSLLAVAAEVSSSLQESLLPKNIHTTFALPPHLQAASRP